jgi:hypothetical protein
MFGFLHYNIQEDNFGIGSKTKTTFVITITMVITVMLVIGSPAIYVNAKKHHHLSDTQKEDSTASDKQGNTCNFGPSHDQCRDEFLQSKDGGSILAPGPGKHFGECEDSRPDAPLGSKCDVLNDDGSPNPG